MSTEPETVSPAPDGASTPETPAAPAAPTYLTLDQFTAAQNQILQTFQTINESLAALRSEAARRPGAEQPQEQQVTPEMYAQAVQTGDALTIERYFDQKQRRYHAEQVAPMQRDGAHLISDLQARVTGSQLPHYARYRKEIDETYGQMPPNVRTQPEAIRIAHDLVVGRHADDLIREARESALRANAGQPNEPGAANGRAVRTDATPSAEALFGRDAVRALGGMSEDGFAQRLGYKDWSAYAKLYHEQVAAGEAR